MKNHLISSLKAICKLVTTTHIFIMSRRQDREITCLMSSTTIQTIYGKTYTCIISKWSKFSSLTLETFCSRKCLILTNTSILIRTRPNHINIINKMYLKNITTINSNRFKMEAIYRWWCSNPHNFCNISNSHSPFTTVYSHLKWKTTKEVTTYRSK